MFIAPPLACSMPFTSLSVCLIRGTCCRLGIHGTPSRCTRLMLPLMWVWKPTCDPAHAFSRVDCVHLFEIRFCRRAVLQCNLHT